MITIYDKQSGRVLHHHDSDAQPKLSIVVPNETQAQHLIAILGQPLEKHDIYRNRFLAHKMLVWDNLSTTITICPEIQKPGGDYPHYIISRDESKIGKSFTAEISIYFVDEGEEKQHKLKERNTFNIHLQFEANKV